MDKQQTALETNADKYVIRESKVWGGAIKKTEEKNDNATRFNLCGPCFKAEN